MAVYTLPVGNVFISWFGPTTALSSTAWFNATNVRGVYKISANRQGYISNKPGSLFPAFTSLDAVSNTDPFVGKYIIIVKQAFTIDTTLIGQPVLGGAFPEPLLMDIDGTTPLPGETVYALDDDVTVTEKSVVTALFSQGTGTVQGSFDNGATWFTIAGTAVVVNAGQRLKIQVLHDNNAAFFATLTVNAS